jgi:hypothetical protein
VLLMPAFVLNTNALDLLGLKSHTEGTFLPGATVTFTIYDKAGVAVPGETWPQVMTYIEGSEADFRGILPAALEMLPNKQYYAHIDAAGGGERIGHWEMPFKPIIRTGLAEGETNA